MERSRNSKRKIRHISSLSGAYNFVKKENNYMIAFRPSLEEWIKIAEYENETDVEKMEW